MPPSNRRYEYLWLIILARGHGNAQPTFNSAQVAGKTKPQTTVSPVRVWCYGTTMAPSSTTFCTKPTVSCYARTTIGWCFNKFYFFTGHVEINPQLVDSMSTADVMLLS